MVTRVQKWGNSQGIRIPRHVLESVRMSVGDEVDVAVEDGAIVLTPAKRLRGKRNLKELLSRIPKDYVVEEVDWGAPSGKETW